MCSFLVTSWLIANLTRANFFLQRRGPDSTSILEKGGFTFVHNLLHMTGERIMQPFVEGDLVAVYNGEIYNSRHVPDGYAMRHKYRSDGECILPCYQHLGPAFPHVLDGEWALVLFDFSEQIVVLSSDVFSTKPLWYSRHDGFHAASYRSALLGLGLPDDSIHMVDPNQILVFALRGHETELISTYTVHEFDTRQFKTSTHDWAHAFRRAVWKRVASSNHPVFVGLSSGYDSGALHLALESEAPVHSVNYFTISAAEIPSVLEERLSGHNKSIARAWKLQLSLDDFKFEQSWLQEFSEPFEYGPDNWAGGTVQEDGASAGLSAIFRRCRRAGLLVYMSGAGADEIISDYGFAGKKFFPHSSFGGVFPENMSAFFPWRSVFLGTQRDYLMKEEIVAGSHGLESRYPFLDRAVVQEFLWLSADAKNLLYKRPVHDFLNAEDYPFEQGEKDGFAASRKLKIYGATGVEVVQDALQDLPVAKIADTLTCSSTDRKDDTWDAAQSRLTAFLATPDDELDIIDQLASGLLSMFGELQNAPACSIGQFCLELFVLLLTSPKAQNQRLNADSSVWATLVSLPWQAVIQSGWPVFSLMHRISSQLSDAPAHSLLSSAANIVPLSGCGGRTHAEDELDVPLVVLATGTDTSVIPRCQQMLYNFWVGSQSAAVLGSARMCEVFAALARRSEPYYRANLADAWHLK